MTPGRATDSVGGRYRLEHRIASGPSADVWRATDLGLSRPVAVKLLHSRPGHDPGALDRFRKSASCTASLVHEGIARVFDYGEPDSADSAERPFLVMELVDGPPLAELLASGPVNVSRAMDVIAQAAAALDAAHQAGRVHGAIGPQNILLSQDGRVKLIGFGAEHGAERDPASASGDLAAGDLAAGDMAPGDLAAGDLAALGVVAHLCLTGGEAPDDGAVPALPDQIPAPVSAFISQLTAREPAAGPATAAEVSRSAAQLRDQLAPPSPPSPAIPASPASHDMAGLSLATQQALGIAAGTPLAAMAPGTPGRRKRRGPAAMPTFAVVALALAAAALFGVLNPHRSAPQAAGTAKTVTVRVDAGGLIGQPVRGVRQHLERLGLLVQVRWQPSDRVSPGKVLYVWPAGSVPAHSLITLIGAIQPPDVATTAPVAGWMSSTPQHRHLAPPARHSPGTRSPHPTPSASPTSSPSSTPSASPSPSGDPSPSTSSSPPTSPPPSGSPSPPRSGPPRG